MTDDLQVLWQSQSSGESSISLDQIHDQARRLERIVARRNRREYVAAAIAIVFFGGIAGVAPSATMRAGAGLVVAAVVLMIHQLHRRGTVAPLPADLALSSALEFYRAQLVRQRDLLRSVWWWGLLPAVPGLLIFTGGNVLLHPELLRGFIVLSVLLVVIMVGVHALNRRVAARIQQRLDRLDGIA